MTDRKQLAPHLHTIALDETVDIDKPWLTEIIERHGLKLTDLVRYESLYLYDSTVAHHLCSFQGCYWLQWYDGRFIWRDELEVPDALTDELEGEMYSWRNDIYVACDSIERTVQSYQEQGVDFRYSDLGATKDDWWQEFTADASDELDGNGYPCGSYDAFLAAQLEGVQSNAPM